MNDRDPALRRIEEALARLDAAKRPPRDWQSRVLAATRSPRPTWRPRAVALAAASLGVIVILLLVLQRTRPERSHLSLRIVVHLGPMKQRGQQAGLGDTLEASASGAPRLAIWIYRNEIELVVACPGGSSCVETDGRMRATMPLDAVGRYSIVALSSDVPLPAPQGKLDNDVAAATRRGATYRTESRTVH
jgi:hypothetical protein